MDSIRNGLVRSFQLHQSGLYAGFVIGSSTCFTRCLYRLFPAVLTIILELYEFRGITLAYSQNLHIIVDQADDC